jgi:biotin carboxylase
VRLCLVASKPTDAVTHGFLPAAARLGLDVTLLTDQPAAHRAALGAAATPGPGMAPPGPAAATPGRPCIVGCDVWDFRSLIGAISERPGPDAVFSNSDHLQAQTALAAGYFGLPGKDWRASLRARDKLLMRRHLAATGTERVMATEVTAATDLSRLPFPAVLKPAEGVASEDVVLAGTPADLAARRAEILARHPGRRLIAEEYLPGTLRTLETLGDGRTRWELGGFRTSLSPPPFFTEERLVWDPPGPGRDQVTAALAALGATFGAAHTEFAAGRCGARLIEVNDRLIGDHCDFLLAAVTGIDLFAQVLRVHLGEPLPAGPPPPRRTHAVAEYIFAEREGVLVPAPPPGPAVAEPGVDLTCWPLRHPGERVTLAHSNRDYLGVITACGDDQGAVERSVAAARAAWRWEIRP